MLKPLALPILMVLALAGCGRSNTIYHDPDTGAASGDGSGSVGTDGRSLLPMGFFDQSVNNAAVDVSAGSARFRLFGGSSAPGSFTDTSLNGNRAGLALTNFDGQLLSDFALALEDTAVGGSPELRASLIVDLKCDHSTLRAVTSNALPVGSASLAVTDQVWTAPAGDVTDDTSAVVVSKSKMSSLTSLLSAYPRACLRNAVSDDPEAVRAISVGAITLSIGGGTSTTLEELTIQSLTVYARTYNTWGVR